MSLRHQGRKLFFTFNSMTLQFKLRDINEYRNWVYDRLNTFNARNRKFDYYPHGYAYECIAELNRYDWED
jgi:hypothetical protein